MDENVADQKDTPLVYAICLKGELSPNFDWFEEFEICCEQGTTVLTGPIPDQAALQGLLRKILDLGLAILSVNTIDPRNDDQET